jgi:hypothetical protein
MACQLASSMGMFASQDGSFEYRLEAVPFGAYLRHFQI